MDDWKRISHFDFCLLQEDNSILVTTCDRRLPAESKLEEFRNSTALCLSNATCCLYKITEKNEQLLLIVWGSEDSVSTIGDWLSARLRVSWKVMPKKMTKMPLCRNCSLEIIQM